MQVGRTNRRAFIAGLGGAAAWPLVARAQQTAMPVVGFLSSVSAETYLLAAFHRGLIEQSYIEARNVAIEYRYAEGQYGMLINPTNRLADAESKLAQQAAQALGRNLILAGASTDGQIDAAFETFAQQKAAGVVVLREAFLESHRGQIVAAAQRYGLPTIGTTRQFAEAGCFISYGTNLSESYREVGIYVGKILRGVSPADLPVLQPTTYELIINLKTAKALGLEIPPSLFARADEVIE